MHLNLLPIFSKEDVVGIGDRDGRIKGWGKGDGSHKQMWGNCRRISTFSPT